MDRTGQTPDSKEQSLGNYLSPLSVWALSFGCAVGWGAFVMPGTTFLPAAGPAGSAIGMLIGAFVMWIIGVNYHYLINRYPDAGGTLTYTIRSFGYDHGFLSAWFLILVYVAIIWANATALSLIARSLWGNMFQFGFMYSVLGYDVYLGEVLLTLAAILITGFICAYNKRLAVGMQVLFSLLLFTLVALSAILIFTKGGMPDLSASPFSSSGGARSRQIFIIVALSPWAFAGFESVSNSAAGFHFDRKRTIWIFTTALITGALTYIFLVLLAAGRRPNGFSDWEQYVGNLDRMDFVAAIPTFYAALDTLGQKGVLLLTIAAVSGIITGLVGNYIAGSRLLYAMAREEILPKYFMKLDKKANPVNAILFLMGISLVIPFLGRTAIGWIIDVNTVGATIAYAYTSVDAFACARKEKNRKIQLTGAVGLLMSLLFFFYFMSWSAGTMSTESYLILAFWSILGFVYFRWIFRRDNKKRFGKSTIVWIGLLFLIFFTSLMWVKQATDEMTVTVVGNIRSFYEEKYRDIDPGTLAETEAYMETQMALANSVLTRNSIIQMIIIISSLGIMISVYSTISQREKRSEIEKVAAQESNKAKTVFLSNMSHDIRTPMNAIIGYIDLAQHKDVSKQQLLSYIAMIKGASHHLLALINDVLEMSRIESGKMELEPIPVNLKRIFDEIRETFAAQMADKKIDFTVDTTGIVHPLVYCDKNRFNRVLLNLVSNAYKFTPEKGTVLVDIVEMTRAAKEPEPDTADFRIRIADSGIGMSEEFAARLFEAFEREKTDTVSNIQGTGLGMSITKSIVDMMKGQINVKTVKNRGTEFTIYLSFALQNGQESVLQGVDQEQTDENEDDALYGKRVLIVEDMPVNREVAKMLLENMGFVVEYVENGKQALDIIEQVEGGYYDAVLMDIQMPVMNGYEASRAIRALKDRKKADIPIIAMTANAFSEDVKRAVDAGMNAHVAKPIDVTVLKNTLRDVLLRSCS